MQLNSWLARMRAKRKIERRVLTSILGLGITGLLGSAGTFALFTASSSNPNNVFTVGSLQVTTTTGSTSATTSLGGGSNQTGTDPRQCSLTAGATVCSTLLKSVNVAAGGMEPGQYLQATVSINNAGTLPTTVALQIQNVKTNNGNNSLYGVNGAAGTAPCASDIAGVAAPGSTGAQTRSNLTTPGYLGTPVAIVGCQDIGRALRITVQDAGAAGTGPQCLFGNDTGGGASGNDNLQAPRPGGFGTGSSSITTFTATGSKLGTGSGSCDDLGLAGLVGRGSPVLAGKNPKDLFGTEASSVGNSSFAGLNGTSNMIFIPGGGSSFSNVNQASIGGDLTHVPQWSAGEAHTFTITLALPDTGATQITDQHHNTYKVGNENPFQGGAVSFDLYWFASQ